MDLTGTGKAAETTLAIAAAYVNSIVGNIANHAATADGHSLPFTSDERWSGK